MNVYEVVRLVEHVADDTASTYTWSPPAGIEVKDGIDITEGLNTLDDEWNLIAATSTAVNLAQGTVIYHSLFLKRAEAKKRPKPGAAWSE